ncbi:MAG: antibiotic biosynthesis monooxygenase [Thermoleophilia bacterium]|nr:antibiotic biosynthesis monooxygenase [Thermoleophilia bacterium]
MSEVVVLAIFTAKEGKVEEVIERFSPVIEQTHGEAGCLAYALHRDVNDPNTLALVERWKSQEDLNAHFGMPYMAEVGNIASELLVEPPRIVFSTPEPVGDPAKSTL